MLTARLVLDLFRIASLEENQALPTDNPTPASAVAFQQRER